MKISRTWLQTYFDQPLPDAMVLADALTFHAFEIESVEGEILDVKVTPNRGHDCLCHRGIAKEVSAILNVPLKHDGFASGAKLEPATDAVSVSIEEPTLCARYIAGYIRNVKVGPSPDWLRDSLEAIGQRSINNVVDATNYVMFNLGQPLHAFDARKLVENDGRYSIGVRKARAGERMLTLDDKEYALSDSMLVIADHNADVAVGIAGVKGGMPAGITEATTDIIIESANFDGVSVRRTAQALKLRTDASSRFEQSISPELAGYGMRAVSDLIVQVAGGEVVGLVDEYTQKPEQKHVSVSVSKINQVLGTKLTQPDVEDAFRRLNFSFTKDGETFAVAAPFERLDLEIPEDLVEEVARIVGYDKVPSTELPGFPGQPTLNQNFFSTERAREDLIAQGYSEIFTSVFSDKGERVVANKVDGVRPYLRATLVDGLKEASEKNNRNKDLLGVRTVRLFEIGAIWRNGEEKAMLGIADEKGVREDPVEEVVAADMYEDLPLSETERYQAFSKYPFIVRDIALWVPAETNAEHVLSIIRQSAGELLVRSEKFDEFKKGDKVSYAFRLVFQSFDKTLTDFDANERIGSVSAALKREGYEIR
jgi:phenylalanyl-tRNA synthetase beta chain